MAVRARRSTSSTARSTGKSLLRRVHGARGGAARRAPRAREYGSILVPIFGTPLDDDIIQTAGRLAAEEDARHAGEGADDRGDLGLRGPDVAADRRARCPRRSSSGRGRRCARAKAVGEEYEGVEVATATVRARRAGQAIVDEARRRGVQAIVLAAEEPSKIRGGALLGGRGGRWTNFVGEATKYVHRQGAVPVILTAPPVDDRAVSAGRAAAATRPLSGAARGPRDALESPADAFILIVGAGRVGSAVARKMLGRRARGLRPRRGPALARAARRRACDTTWEDAGGRFTVGHGARGRRAASRPGSRRPTSSSPRPTATTRTSRSPRSPSAVRGAERHRPRDGSRRAPSGTRSRACRRSARRGSRSRCSRSGSRSSRCRADVRDHRRRRQGRAGTSPASSSNKGARGDADRAAARPLSDAIEQELEHVVQYGDATELWVLERAGHPARRPGRRGHRRRRGQPPRLPDRQGEVPLSTGSSPASTTRATASTSSCSASSRSVSARPT